MFCCVTRRLALYVMYSAVQVWTALTDRYVLLCNQKTCIVCDIKSNTRTGLPSEIGILCNINIRLAICDVLGDAGIGLSQICCAV